MEGCANCYSCQVCYSCEGTCETCQSCYQPERGGNTQCANCFTCQVCYTCEGACETCQLGYAGDETVQGTIEERLSRLERMVEELYNIVKGQGQVKVNVSLSPAGCDEYEAVPQTRPQKRNRIDLR